MAVSRRIRLWYQIKSRRRGDYLMNKASVDDAASDKRLEEQVDEKLQPSRGSRKYTTRDLLTAFLATAKKGGRRRTK